MGIAVTRVKRPTFIDLFSGCGGLAWGFMQSGFEPAAAVEFDEAAAETYAQNIDTRVHQLDIALVNQRDLLPEADVVIGGPPCQGYSQLGSRDPSDPRNRLWLEYVRVLDSSRARFFVMENVPQFLHSTQFSLFIKAVTSPDRRFRVSYGVLRAADFGVPQLRSRAIVLGYRDGNPLLPIATHGPRANSTPHVTVRQAFQGLPLRPDGRNWHRGRPNVQDFSVTRYKAVPADGGDRFAMQAALERRGRGDLVPECWRRKTTGTTDVFGRLWWDRPSSTIRTEFYKPEKGRYLHPEAHRAITVREAARLQSFPDEFSFPEDQSMASVARQIGNAVPPLLSLAVAATVARQLGVKRAPAVARQRPAASAERRVAV